MEDYEALIYKAEGVRDRAVKELLLEKKALEGLKTDLSNLEKAQAFLQKVAQDTQDGLKVHIEGIVQLALDAVFPDQYRFETKFETAYGKTAAMLNFYCKDTGHCIDPMAASGGGVVDVCSFALRVACWALSKGVDRILILDEPFRFLSRNLQGKAGEMLAELSEKLGMQIIMVTHLEPLIECAGRVICIRKRDGVSEVSYKEEP